MEFTQEGELNLPRHLTLLRNALSTEQQGCWNQTFDMNYQTTLESVRALSEHLKKPTPQKIVVAEKPKEKIVRISFDEARKASQECLRLGLIELPKQKPVLKVLPNPDSVQAKGGVARYRKLSTERRKEIAILGAKKMWERRRNGGNTSNPQAK